MPLVSNAEADYIRTGVQRNLRNDGRNRLKYRSIWMENEPLPHANGKQEGDGK